MSLMSKRERAAYERAMALLEQGFQELPVRPSAGAVVEEEQTEAEADEAIAAVLGEVAEKLRNTFPFHHPLYVGQMLKPPHPVARLAYAMAQTLNPNNHALDGGPASSTMEKDVVRELGAMMGWAGPLGHLTGGGTVANFEALWVAREEMRRSKGAGQAVLASADAHYTHRRLCGVLDVPFVAAPVDSRRRIDVERLSRLLDESNVGTVVATMGTTPYGAVDPLHRIVDLCAARKASGKPPVRIHVDAAYGGYFRLIDGLEEDTLRAFQALEKADSIAIDPHKHGLQPYGCGAVLFRDPAAGMHYRHDSPYTYFSSDELHLGEISLECSRAGAAAVALWATMRLLPLKREGRFARDLGRSRRAALRIHDALFEHPTLRPVLVPELDIVVVAVKSDTASTASVFAKRIFEACAERDLHVALMEAPREVVEPTGAVGHWDVPNVRCLRLCTMKPDHLAWADEIVDRLQDATTSVIGDSPNAAPAALDGSR